MAIIVVVVGDNKVESGDPACDPLSKYCRQRYNMCVGRPTKFHLSQYQDALQLEEDLVAYVVCPGLNLNWWLRINLKLCQLIKQQELLSPSFILLHAHLDLTQNVIWPHLHCR